LFLVFREGRFRISRIDLRHESFLFLQNQVQNLPAFRRCPNPANETVRIFVFQAVRELLFNVVKHAGAAQARVALSAERDKLDLLVRDDGCGFDATRNEVGFPGSAGILPARA